MGELRARVVSLDIESLRLELRDKDAGLAIALYSRDEWVRLHEDGRERVWDYMSRKFRSRTETH